MCSTTSCFALGVGCVWGWGRTFQTNNKMFPLRDTADTVELIAQRIFHGSVSEFSQDEAESKRAPPPPKTKKEKKRRMRMKNNKKHNK